MITSIARHITAWWARRTAQALCGHHWHAAGFIDWQCCRCGKNVDGFPPPDRNNHLTNGHIGI